MLSGEPRTGNPKSRKTKPDGATLGLLLPTTYPIARSPDASEAADERTLQGCYIKQKGPSVFAVAVALDELFHYPGSFRAVPQRPSGILNYLDIHRLSATAQFAWCPCVRLSLLLPLEMHLTHLQLRL